MSNTIEPRSAADRGARWLLRLLTTNVRSAPVTSAPGIPL